MSEELFDIAVIGGGLGGIYAAHRFTNQGLSVVGLEGGSSFGGVWYNNGYPGSRVDTDSVDYCYHFSAEIYTKWPWVERYAPQPDLLEYLNFVADTIDVRRFFRFNTWLRDARWSESDKRWHLLSDRGDRVACRFLVMCCGQLSEPVPPPFLGLERFRGQWALSSRWPQEEVPLAGRRIGLVGTGSSGSQVVPVAAREAEHVFVFQRNPHFAVPARNGPTAPGLQESIGRNLAAERERMFTQLIVPRGLEPPKPASDYTPAQRLDRLERQWEFGGHGMQYLFSDQTVDRASNDIVASFVKDKIRQTVTDPVVAEKLCPTYPIGTHRLILEIGYYDVFNQDNVSLVDVKQDPIVEITETGVRTTEGHCEVDLLIFALGFRAFNGALDTAGIRNGNGQLPGEVWHDGPRTLLGLMTPGYPNMFTITGAGSPATLFHLFLMNEFHIEWASDCIDYMDRSGHATIEASEAASDEWGRVCFSYAEKLLRRQEDTYLVHVNDDGTRIFMPFAGPMYDYVAKARDVVARDYQGFVFN